MLNMNKEEIKQEQNKGLIARILGGTPTILQKVFFILMAFSLILWPLGCYVSIFFFDAPVRSDVDKNMSLWYAYNHLHVSYLLVPFVEIYVSTFKELKSNLALLSMSDSTNINS